ncbi:MAG: helix-turn-helix transcriptional regulator [Azospirillaceae bacterium]
MDHALEEIGTTLKEARQRRGLSQRALSAAAAVPQAQISKIENGSIDLKVSTLLKLARTLDLEPVLAPRRALPAVHSIIRGTAPGRAKPETGEWSRYLAQALEKTAGSPERTDYAQLVRTLRELKRLEPGPDRRLPERIDAKRWNAWLRARDDEEETRRLVFHLRDLRNRAMHENARDSGMEVKPAYSLDEDGDA